MDIKEILKIQMITGNGHHPGGAMYGHGQSHGGGMMAAFYQLLFMMCLTAVDDIVKAFVVFCSYVKEVGIAYYGTKVQASINSQITFPLLSDTGVLLNTRHSVSKLVMKRTYPATDGSGGGTGGGSGSASDATASEETNLIVDAVLAQISKLSNVPSFNLIDKGHIIVTYKDKPIQMTRDIYVKIDSIHLTPVGNVSYITLTLMSNTIPASSICNYVHNIYNTYLEDLKNSLGSNIYYFDHKATENPTPPIMAGRPGCTDEDIMMQKRMRINSAPKQLPFDKAVFYSNKQFSNIFGKEVREVEKRVRFFLENKDWYDAKGVPYQLGLLLSGIPGSGKSSCIKAIANLTKRHIINVNFANITTSMQLKNLFLSDKIQVCTDQTQSTTQSYHIPIDQRLYVLEELDAIGNIVKQRGATDPNEPTVVGELTLAEILTILDGTMETPGRIIIMTSNHPEVLDKALVRPGRIDVNVTFGYAAPDLIADMYNAYFDKELSQECLATLMIHAPKLTPAEVGQVMFKYFDTDFDEADVLNALVKAKLLPIDPSTSWGSMSLPQISELLVTPTPTPTHTALATAAVVKVESENNRQNMDENLKTSARIVTKNIGTMNWGWSSLNMSSDGLQPSGCDEYIGERMSAI